jgi:hypothetical protein
VHPSSQSQAGACKTGIPESATDSIAITYKVSNESAEGEQKSALGLVFQEFG